MSLGRPSTFFRALAAASVMAVILVMLAPLWPGGGPDRPLREGSVIPLLAANGLMQSGAFNGIGYEPRLSSSEQPQFRSVGERTRERPAMRSVTVRKRVRPLSVDVTAPRQSWKRLGADVRRKIDRAAPGRYQSHAIVLHGSGGLGAPTAGSLDRFHRRLLGLAAGGTYDFVIGSDEEGGGVRIGDRWRSPQGVEGEVRICIRGDFQTQGPGPLQLQALDELVDYLRLVIGHLEVTTHARIAGRRVSCMGEAFPETTVLEALNTW